MRRGTPCQTLLGMFRGRLRRRRRSVFPVPAEQPRQPAEGIEAATGLAGLRRRLGPAAMHPVGYALGRRIDARLTLAALTTAIENRNPPPGCIHHSDRGSQYAAQAYRALLSEHGPVGSMARRGNPYDNAMMEKWNGRLPPPMPSGARAQVDPRGPTASRC